MSGKGGGMAMGIGGTKGGTGGAVGGSGGAVGGSSGAIGGSHGAAGGTGSGGNQAAGGGSATGGAAGGASGTISTSLGKVCTVDTDCGGSLICLKATDKLLGTSGGAANGYCTRKCVVATLQADAAACTAAGGTCLDFSSAGDGSAGYCMLDCTVGDVGSASKCQGRADSVCAGLMDSTGAPAGAACIPLCAADADCPAGRKCSLAEGFCEDVAPTGAAMGAHCTADPQTGASECAGLCLPIGDSNNNVIASYCTQACVLGNLGCNIAASTQSVAGGTHGVCLLPADQTAGAGDLGYCVVECDSLNDCPDKTDPNPICDASQTMSVIGHGICSWM